MDNSSNLLRRDFERVGGVSCPRSYRFVPMDNGDSSNRVADAEARYLAWRQVTALETIAAALSYFEFVVIFASVFYLVYYLWPKGDA